MTKTIITSYSDYCIALKNGSSSARMVFELRNWFIKEYKYIGSVSNGSYYIGLDALKAIESLDMKYDFLSYIVCESMDSFFRIFEKMREKNSRENVVMPIQKAKEINSSSIIWLCRQPGRTAREKIGNANNKILAVRRFISHDTPENRLLIACAELLCSRIQEKINLIGEKHCSHEEITFLNKANMFLHSDEAMSISKWNNTPPNNALLSDRNYKKVWGAWTSLKELDLLVKKDFENITDNSFTLFKVELLANLKNFFLLPQLPISINYIDFCVDFNKSEIYGYDAEQNSIRIKIDNNFIEVRYKDYNVRFENDVISSADKISDECLLTKVNEVIRKMNISDNRIIRNTSKSLEYSAKKYIDIISAVPVISDSLYKTAEYNPRMIYQEFLTENNKYLLSCYSSDILMVDDSIRTFTIKSAAEEDRIDVLQKIFSVIKKNINTSSLAMLINDGYDAFQLKNYKKSARSSFSNAELFPESIGAAFWYQYFSEKFEGYKTGDIIIVANIIGNNYSLTPLSSEQAELDINEGLIWERYPTRIEETDAFDILRENLMKIGCSEHKALEILDALGLKSIYKASKDLFFNFEDNSTQSLEQHLHGLDNIISVDISEKANKIISDIIGEDAERQAHIILLSDVLVYSGKHRVIRADSRDVIYGAVKHDEVYAELKSNKVMLTHDTLWKDHLPDLAIQLLIGEFPLIKNAQRSPVLGKKQKIEINSRFTLTAGKKEYHFKLIQNDNGSDLRYEAVIRNEAFPLTFDTECYLNMYYQYDADDVYSLEFVPVNRLGAEFIKAKVEFEKSSDEEYNDLPIPNYPKPVSWDELYSLETEYCTTNVVKNLQNGFEKIANWYYYFDFTGKQCPGENGSCDVVIDGQKKILLWNKKSWDVHEKIPEYIADFSCILDSYKARDEKRYYLPDLWVGHFKGDLWYYNRYGSYQCFREIEYEGKTELIRLYDSEFADRAMFHPGIKNVSFDIIKNRKDGKLKAVNIHDEDRGPYVAIERLRARGIRNGNTIPGDMFGKNLFYMMYKAFSSSNNRSVTDDDCPEQLRNAFLKAAPKWIDAYYQTNEKILKRKLLLGMSLMAKDFGEGLYPLINEAVDSYVRKEVKLADDVGCSLCDLSKEYEKQLLNHMLDVLSDDKMMAVLSKALWNNEKLIYNVDVDVLLKYLSVACGNFKKRVENYDNNKKESAYKKLSDIAICLEYILAILRLREKKDERLNKYSLSLYNPELKNVYKILEMIAMNPKKFSGIRSFLQVEIANKGSYENVPDIIYTMLVYISGHQSEGDIKISGVNIGEDE